MFPINYIVADAIRTPVDITHFIGDRDDKKSVVSPDK